MRQWIVPYVQTLHIGRCQVSVQLESTWDYVQAEEDCHSEVHRRYGKIKCVPFEIEES